MPWPAQLARLLKRPAGSDWRDVSLDGVPRAPGMTQPDELKYFYWCCANLHRRGRRVVELGSWLGNSTLAMAAGLRESVDPAAKVTAIDYFRWDEWTFNAYAKEIVKSLTEEQRALIPPAALRSMKVDDSFLPIFRAVTKPFEDSIEPIAADLEHYRWTGEPIDVLMIDAAKSWPTFDQIIRQFFPCLTNGASVIHQDYKHWFCYWLHIVTERMLERGVLSMAENVDKHPTQGFRFHVRRDFRVEDYQQAAFRPAEIDRLLARSVERFRDPDDRLAVVGCYIRYLRDQNRAEDAKALFTDAICQGGFSEGFALADLITYNPEEWVRPLAHLLPDCFAAKLTQSA